MIVSPSGRNQAADAAYFSPHELRTDLPQGVEPGESDCRGEKDDGGTSRLMIVSASGRNQAADAAYFSAHELRAPGLT
jgi:hypothetical protein